MPRIVLKTFQTIGEFDSWLTRRLDKIKNNPTDPFLNPPLKKGQPVIIEDLEVLRITTGFNSSNADNPWEYLEFKINTEKVQYISDGTTDAIATGTTVIFHSGTMITLPRNRDRAITRGDKITLLCVTSEVNTDATSTIVGPLIHKGVRIEQITNILEFQQYEFIHLGWKNDYYKETDTEDPSPEDNEELDWVIVDYPKPDKIGDKPLMNIAPYDTFRYRDSVAVKERIITHNLKSNNIRVEVISDRNGERIIGEQVFISILDQNRIKVVTTDEVILEVEIISGFLTNPINEDTLAELLGVSLLPAPNSIPQTDAKGNFSPAWLGKFGATGKNSGIEIYNTPGDYTFNFPDGTVSATVMVIGGGGGSSCMYIDENRTETSKNGTPGGSSRVAINDVVVYCEGGYGGKTVNDLSDLDTAVDPNITGSSNALQIFSSPNDAGIIGTLEDMSNVSGNGKRGYARIMSIQNSGFNKIISGGNGCVSICQIVGSLSAASITVGAAGENGNTIDNFAESISTEFKNQCEQSYRSPTGGRVVIVY